MMIGPSAPNGPPVPIEIAEEIGFRMATLADMRLRPIRMASIASGIPCPRIRSDAIARHQADDQPTDHGHQDRPVGRDDCRAGRDQLEDNRW